MAASTSAIDCSVFGSGISPNAQRSTDTMPRPVAISEVSTRSASRAWQLPHVFFTVESAPGSGSMPACAASLVDASRSPRWQEAQPTRAAACAPPGSSLGSEWHATQPSGGAAPNVAGCVFGPRSNATQSNATKPTSAELEMATMRK